MGLDILACQHARLTEPHELDSCDGDENHVYTANDEAFEHTLGSLLRNRCYETSGEKFHFRAGSYSSYGAWRAALCMATHGVPPAVIWRDPKTWEGKAFYEIINFSDCDGVIGPEVARKLANDFREQRNKVRPRLYRIWGGDGARLYDEWQKALELAAGDGIVLFT